MSRKSIMLIVNPKAGKLKSRNRLFALVKQISSASRCV
jgi:hypothetical protein